MSRPLAVMDFEAHDWNRVRLAVAVTEYGDRYTFRNSDEARAWAEAWGGDLWGHYAGKYDWLFLMPLQCVTMSSGLVISAQLGLARLHDSSRLFGGPLAELGKAVGLPKFSNRSDRIERLSDLEVEEHAERDCQIVLRGLVRLRSWVQQLPHRGDWFPSTAGAISAFAAEALEPAAVAQLKRHPMDPDDHFRQSEAVQGARTEIHYIGKARGAWAYDIRSSYASRWGEGPVPLGPWRQVPREVPRKQGVYFCSVMQSRDHYPVVAPNYTWRYDGEAWCTSEEIAQVRDWGGIVEVMGGWVSEQSGPFGGATAAEVYKARREGLPGAKGILTGLHGKAVQQLTSDVYMHTSRGYVRDRSQTPPRWFQRPLLGSFIYARARLALARVKDQLRALGCRVYYCDTDNVHTDCPPERFPGRLGDGCGDWRVEHGPCSAVYIAPKVYALRGPDGVLKVACRGIDPKAINWSTLSKVAGGESVVVRGSPGLAGFRSAMGHYGLPRVKDEGRTLRQQTGGKDRDERKQGWLRYPDA